MTTRQWVDWVNIILGVWLLASPWLLSDPAGELPAAWNSWSAGIGIMTLALLAMRKPAVWGDAMRILLGTWLIASPWVLGFASASTAVSNAVILGSLLIGYGFWATYIDITAAKARRKILIESELYEGSVAKESFRKRRVQVRDRRLAFEPISRTCSRNQRAISRHRGSRHKMSIGPAAAVEARYVPRQPATAAARVGPTRRQRAAENDWENEGGSTRPPTRVPDYGKGDE